VELPGTCSTQKMIVGSYTVQLLGQQYREHIFRCMPFIPMSVSKSSVGASWCSWFWETFL